MCIVIRGDGHLNIKLLYEQNKPILNNGSLEFIECFDVVLRNFSNHPMDHLHVLSPHISPGKKVSPHYVYPVLRYPEIGFFDWVFMEKINTSETKGTYQLSIPSPSVEEGPMRFEVTTLVPVITSPSWMTSSDINDRIVKGVFQATEMMCAKVEFENNQVIEPYDPNRPIETTYWLRLAYKPMVSHPVEPPIKFKIDTQKNISIQPCTCYGPETILNRLRDEINLLRGEEKYAQYVPIAQKALFEGLFEKANTSTMIDDYRINVISSNDFLVMNPCVEGPCGFAGLESLPEKSNYVARSWMTGSSFYPSISPLVLANQIYNYINEWAYNSDDAKTKEQLAATISPENHSNICHVTNVLAQLGFITEPKLGLYSSIKKEGIAEKGIELQPPDTYTKNLDYVRDSHCKLLTLLHGTIGANAKKQAVSFFKPKGFRVQYELIYS